RIRQKLFVNGNLKTSSTAFGGNITTNNNALFMGRDLTHCFNGQIDEVRIYNRTLSPKEVHWLYEWTLADRHKPS
ncbi:unnamed protein product, partial [marine sediment metagenome]